MKIYEIGTIIYIGKGAPGLVVTGYEKDKDGNVVGYEVRLVDEIFDIGKPIVKTPIDQ